MKKTDVYILFIIFFVISSLEIDVLASEMVQSNQPVINDQMIQSYGRVIFNLSIIQIRKWQDVLENNLSKKALSLITTIQEQNKDLFLICNIANQLPPEVQGLIVLKMLDVLEPHEAGQEHHEEQNCIRSFLSERLHTSLSYIHYANKFMSGDTNLEYFRKKIKYDSRLTKVILLNFLDSIDQLNLQMQGQKSTILRDDMVLMNKFIQRLPEVIPYVR